MLTWFNQHIKPGQDCQYVNAVAWFSTHYPAFTASNLLNHYSGHAGERTPVGDTKTTPCFRGQEFQRGMISPIRTSKARMGGFLGPKR
jgi:hypothetical protein